MVFAKNEVQKLSQADTAWLGLQIRNPASQRALYSYNYFTPRFKAELGQALI